MKVYLYPPDRSSPRQLIAEGSERECRRAAARALGRQTLRGCPSVATNDGAALPGTFYYEPAVAYDEARAVELVE